MYHALEPQGLVIVGGRNSAVGVGRFTLGGGISFFSPQHGLASSDVVCYEVVLDYGDVVMASAERNAELWRALMGGGNNFGIVTRFTMRCFPATSIWSGFVYMTGGQAPKAIAAFHECVAKADPSHRDYDLHAGGPMACFTYLRPLGIQAVSIHLAHANPPENKDWPACWQNSSFKSLWRVWSTFKKGTMIQATDELTALNPPGKRKEFATTAVKNDLPTLMAAHRAYHDAISSIRSVRNISWTLVLQPLDPRWASMGGPNPLGLEEVEGPLVIVEFTVNWTEGRDDEAVRATTGRAIEQIGSFAEDHGTGHQYRFLNYCGAWQKPFQSYGEENLRLLRQVSRRYDGDGLFQKGCVGGFKLDMED